MPPLLGVRALSLRVKFVFRTAVTVPPAGAVSDPVPVQPETSNVALRPVSSACSTAVKAITSR
ncbi:MAG: hypothetical protein U0736_02385 [Gemmataceae bacterium]